MSDSPESLVRRYFASWADPRADVIRPLFADDAVWVDGPQGVRRGADAITAEITAQLKAVGGVTVDLVSLLSDGRTVMVEQVSRSESVTPRSPPSSWQSSSSTPTAESPSGARPTT